MGLSFVNDTDPIVASPAPLFFSVPVVSSQDLEVPGIMPPDDPVQLALSRLVKARGTVDWSAELAQRDFKYILLAREGDWTTYDFLNSQAHLGLVADYGSILLYKNLLWGGASSP